MPVANLVFDEEKLWKMVEERRKPYLGKVITPEYLQQLFDETLIHTTMFAITALLLTKDVHTLKLLAESFAKILETTVDSVCETTQDNLPPDILKH